MALYRSSCPEANISYRESHRRGIEYKHNQFGALKMRSPDKAPAVLFASCAFEYKVFKCNILVYRAYKACIELQ